MTELRIGNWKEATTKKGGSFLIFNLQVDTDTLLLGWRIINGLFYPPSTRGSGYRFYPVVYVSRGVAEALYDHVKANHDFLLTNFPTAFKGLHESKEEAIQEIIWTPGLLARYMGGA